MNQIRINRICILGLSLFVNLSTMMGQQDDSRLLQGLESQVSVSGTTSSGSYAPLWLSANSYGLNSVEQNSAWQRVELFRPLDADSLRLWRLGYGMDVALHENSVSTFDIQQLYASLQYRKLRLTLGSKHQEIDLRNNELTSGGLGIGINARPIPQVKAEMDYFSIPGTHGWWQWKGRISYGMFTDNAWVKDFQHSNNRYALNTLYHEKALYWKFGREDVFPMTFEIGLQMASQFGGTTYHAFGRNITSGTTLHHSHGLKAFWNALVAGGSDETDGTESNTGGNHLGSYNMALSYKGDGWKARAYFERYFEDQSMLTLQYGIYDHLAGIEVNLPSNRFVSSFVIEHLSTKDQSGAVYHDATATMPEKMNGRDDYYNHLLYNGWQHWGQAMGHPFLTSPVYSHTKAYDSNGYIYFRNNRVQAWHFALAGDPSLRWHYRMLMSFTRNWGTYNFPLPEVLSQCYLMAEATYRPGWWNNGSMKMGMAYDQGKLLGNSFGVQLTLSKRFFL